MNNIHLKTDLNLLRVLVAIYRERQLARAAASLALTPSAISHALRRLREQFNDPLFLRSGRQLRPTPMCDKLAPEVHELLLRMQGLIERGKSFVPHETRRVFRLGIPEAIEPELFPRLYTRLANAAPHARFESIAVPHSQLSEHLLNRIVDVAIDVALPIGGPIHQRPLSREPFVVLGRRNGLSTLTSGRYLSARHIVVSSRPRGTVLEDYLLRELGIERRLGSRVQSYQTAGQLVASTDDLLTLPKPIAARLVNQFSVELWETPFDLTPTRLQIYWHDAHAQDPGTEWLRNVISGVNHVENGG